jgi:hypothetical protein
MRKLLWSSKEKEIVLVTHGAFLHYLTEDWDGFVDGHGEFPLHLCLRKLVLRKMVGTAYKNCEYRCFTFTEDSNEKEPYLIQVGKKGERVTKPFGAHAKDISGVLPN